MSTATFIHDGDTLDFTPAADVAANTVVVLGDVVGVAKFATAAGQQGSLSVTGVFDVPKATGTGTEIAAGASLFWNAASQVVATTSNSGVHKRLGNATVGAAAADATVRARLNTGVPDAGQTQGTG